MTFPGLPARAPLGHRSFAVERQHDESGVSGVGVVLEGVVFGTGVTVVHWLQPPPRGSINVFDSFEQFMSIHVGPHPSNQTRILWSDGTVWEPGDYPHAPTPWAEVPRPEPTTLRLPDEAPVLCRDCRGRGADDDGPCSRCGAAEPYDAATSTLAWALTFRASSQRNTTVDRPTVKEWDLAARLAAALRSAPVDA